MRCDYNGQELVSVDAFIPPADDLIAEVGTMLDRYGHPGATRSAGLAPRDFVAAPGETAALQATAELGDEAASEALRHLISIQLVRLTLSDDGRAVVLTIRMYGWEGTTS